MVKKIMLTIESNATSFREAVVAKQISIKKFRFSELRRARLRVPAAAFVHTSRIHST